MDQKPHQIGFFSMVCMPAEKRSKELNLFIADFAHKLSIVFLTLAMFFSTTLLAMWALKAAGLSDTELADLSNPSHYLVVAGFLLTLSVYTYYKGIKLCYIAHSIGQICTVNDEHSN